MRFPQKESLGEYGSGWGWDYVNVHVLSQENVIDRLVSGNIVRDTVPIRFIHNDTIQSVCSGDYEYTNGELLASHDFMFLQKSCKPNIGNAGNYYSWPASTAGGSKDDGHEENSICPLGWMLSTDYLTDIKSFYYSIEATYGGKNSDVSLLPFSILRFGRYDDKGNVVGRGENGYIWLAVAGNFGNYYAHFLMSSNNIVNTGNKGNKFYGHSLRCARGK